MFICDSDIFLYLLIESPFVYFSAFFKSVFFSQRLAGSDGNIKRQMQ